VPTQTTIGPSGRKTVRPRSIYTDRPLGPIIWENPWPPPKALTTLDHGFGPSGKVDATPRTDRPALRRLLALASLLALGYGLWLLRPPADPMAEETKARISSEPVYHFPAQELRPLVPLPTDPDPVRSLRQGEPLVVGTRYFAFLPDLRSIVVRYLGTSPTFSALPKNPQLGDMYSVTESPGTLWIWAVPVGFNHPAWIDP
jgi:hypothetical protein